MNFDAARESMVDDLARRGVTDPRVLAALRRVPREQFVPASHQARAYADSALSIGEGQTISQPYMVAAMTSALKLARDARVLEIGTGSGYQAAILGELAREVITIERKPALAAEASARLTALGYRNVRVLVGDGSEGVPADAPFDGILVTAGAPGLPPSLIGELAEGGRLVIPIGSQIHQELVVARKVGADVSQTSLFGCVFVPLIGSEAWPG